jgi:two-component system phosphate regulon sensor histidine kinase PhoR
MGEIDQLTSIIHVALSNSNLQMERIQSENIKMNEVFAHMTDGVIITDAQGNIRFINPTAQKMFGVSKDDAENHSIAKVLRHHQLIELWQRCRDSDQVQSISSEIGMDKLYINGIATPLGSGMPGGILLLFQDLTQLKKLEIVRRDFVSNISHELRTPLATIKALSETLMDSALEDPPTARKFIQNIDIEVDSLTQIVDELLELSRIESGKLSLKMELISPCQIMYNAVDRLYVQSERSNLTVEINCQESLPPVLADQERIERLMVNLLHNAIKFTPSGGMIRLSAEIHSENNNQFILFTLSDTGIGIPEEDLSRIFERFYKSDRARAGGGSGLGLSIAQHIVQIHEGRIWAESIEGKGSSFHFILPLSSNLS